MKKSDREIIFNKFNGRCAYCGQPLGKVWHVDEKLPILRQLYFIRDEAGNRIFNYETRKSKCKTTIAFPERKNIDNQYPACPNCNILKGAKTIEGFRELIAGFMKHLNERNTQYKMAKKYGLVKETSIDVKFYFENEYPR